MRSNFYTGNHRHSKVLEKLAKSNPDKIAEYFADQDGHWIYLKDGWQEPNSYCSVIREHTVKECLSKFRTLVVGTYQ